MVPLVGFIIVPLGLLATLTVPVFEPLARLLFSTAGLFVKELLILTESWYRFSAILVVPVTLSMWEVMLYYGALVGTVLCLRRGKRRIALVGPVGFLLVELMVIPIVQNRGDGRG